MLKDKLERAQMKSIKNSLGFAATELIVFVLLIGLMGGAGYLIFSKSKHVPTGKAATNSAEQSEERTTLTDKELGTAEGAQKLNDFESAKEQKTTDNFESQNQNSTLNDLNSVGEISEAYNVDF